MSSIRHLNKCGYTPTTQEFVEDLDCVVRWEQLNGCQEASYEDIPSSYWDCLSVFLLDTSRQPEHRARDGTLRRDLLSLLGATYTKQPWSLPRPLHDLSEEDKHWTENVWAHGLSKVQPTAAVYSPKMATTHDASRLGFIRREDCKALVGPVFASTVITSSEGVFGRQVSFHTLRRYNRLATTSVLRVAHSLGIDIPVIGILLCGNLVAIHIDWYQVIYGEFTCNSAFYSVNDEEAEIKVWDLDKLDDVQQLTQIISNIRNYTLRYFDARIGQQWNTSRMTVSKASSLQDEFPALHLDDIPSPPSTPDASIQQP